MAKTRGRPKLGKPCYGLTLREDQIAWLEAEAASRYGGNGSQVIREAIDVARRVGLQGGENSHELR